MAFAAFVHPSSWADRASGVLERTHDGAERASRDTPCTCGAPLRAHSPHWPYDSTSCNGFQQKPGTHRLRPETRPRVHRLPSVRALERQPVGSKTPAVFRAQLHDALRGFSAPRTARCRSKRVGSTVQVQREGERVSIVGLETCGSVWACPTCAARIYAKRAEQLGQAFESWQSSEPTMVTLTVRHGRADNLQTLRRGLAKAWEYLWRGRAGMARRKNWGIRHWVRAIEVSHGPNGWHPHIHAFVFAMHPIGDAAKRELAMAWRRAVVSALGFKFRPSVRRGVDVRPRGCARQYLAKMGLEIHAITKRGRTSAHRSPWQIAADAARGDARAVGLWQEYVRAMFGTRQLTWSRGAKERFALEDVSDDEAAKEPALAELLAQWTGKAWDRHRWAPGWLSRVVSAAHSSCPLTELSALPGVSSRAPPGIVKCRGVPSSERAPELPTVAEHDRRVRTSPAVMAAAAGASRRLRSA